MAVKGSNAQIIQTLAADPKSVVYTALSQEDLSDLNSVYDNIMQTTTLRNDFVNALVQQIALISVNKAMFTNSLSFLKSANMKYGQTEEEIFVNMVEDSDYNFYAEEKEIFKLYKSNVMAAFHDVNFKKKWAVTISYDELRNAFRDEYGLQQLINAKVDVLYSSASYKEYLMTKGLLTQGYQHGCIYPVAVPAPQDETAIKDVLQTVRGLVDKLRFPNPKYNYAGSDATSTPENLVFFTSPEVNAALDVNALAYAFHMDKAEITTRTVILDSLPSGVYGFLADARFFKIREQLREFAENYRGDNLRWNYFYHLWEMFSISPFYPCIVLTSNDIAGDSITISGDATAHLGTQVVYKAEITDSNSTPNGYVPQAVDWEITSTVTGNTTAFVPGSGILIVDPKESATTITIKVTSRYNTSVSATKTVNVQV